jgi:hypothetical protein
MAHSKEQTAVLMDEHGRTWASMDTLLDNDPYYYKSLQEAIVNELSTMSRVELEHTLELIRTVRPPAADG